MKRRYALWLTVVWMLCVLQTVPMRVHAAVNPVEKPIVIVLDPGHGGKDPGAVRTWSRVKYEEKSMNLVIALACKEELEKYAGVKVYMTRETDVSMGLQERVQFAKKRKAALFVSLHNNAGTQSSRRGASVFYPNRSMNKSVSRQGMGVAEKIQKKLVGLGLNNRGITYRNSENGSRYKNNSIADYYSVIRNSKLEGFPGIIVEHAYVSSPSDCKNFLSTDNKLRKLGVADAKGIAEYYGLTRGSSTVLTSAVVLPEGSVSLEWTKARSMDGYAVYRREFGKKKFKRIALLEGKKALTYCDETVKPGETYEYMVRAYRTSLSTARYVFDENILQVFVLLPPAEPVLQKTEENLSVLSWGEAKGAAGYQLARQDSEEEAFVVVADIADGAALTWLDPVADEKEGHAKYRICAYAYIDNQKQCSPYVDVREIFVDNPEESSEVEEEQTLPEENVQNAQIL